MSVRVSAPGWVASKFAKILTPIEDSLEFVGIYHEDVVQGVRANIGLNLACDKRNGIVYGTPTQHGDGKSVLFKGGSNFVQSRWRDTAAQSHLMIGATDDTIADSAHRPEWLSSSLGIPTSGGVTNTFGTRLHTTAAGTARFTSGRGTTTSNDVAADAVVSATITGYVPLMALSPGGVGDNTLINLATDATNSSAVNLARMVTVNLFRYGSGFGTNTGTCRIHSVISATKLWSADEQARAEEFMTEIAIGYGALS